MIHAQQGYQATIPPQIPPPPPQAPCPLPAQVQKVQSASRARALLFWMLQHHNFNSFNTLQTYCIKFLQSMITSSAKAFRIVVRSE